MIRRAVVPALVGAMIAFASPAAASSPAHADTVVVSPTGPITTLTAAMKVVGKGGTILVRGGEYREPTVLVDRAVTIVGEGQPVFDGEGQRQLLTITADDVTVRGLHFRNTGSSFMEDRAAIRVTSASRCTIEDNVLEETYFGIYLARVSDCRLSRNVIRASGNSEATSGNGIHIFSSSSITMEDNHVTGHRDGIYLEFGHGSSARRNVAERNMRYGLHFMYSNDCLYEENVFRHNLAGVAVMYSRGVHMLGNRFERNWGSAAYGLLLKEIVDSEVRGNRFERNSTAILADGATRLVAERNEFIGNGWAVRLMASSQDARFERNNFIGNTFDVSTNSRRSYSTFRGNYWDVYRGYDLDRDGFGDVPHHPVRLFSLIVERFEPALVLLRSFLVGMLDAAERVLPGLTPEGMADERPAMKVIR